MDQKTPAKRRLREAQPTDGESRGTVENKRSQSEESNAVDGVDIPCKPVNSSISPPAISTPLKQSRSAPTLLSSSVSVKRQRLHNASAAMSTLTKPFRSPLLSRRAESPSDNTKRPSSTLPPQSTPSKVSSSNDKAQTPTATKRGPPIQRRIGTPAAGSLFTPADPELAALSGHVTHLRNRLKAAQTHYATSQQALLLESLPSTHKDSDEHLKEVTLKWRAAARQAADYLFGIAGDKINMMGGPKAYFDRQRERKIKWDGDDNAGGNGWGGDENDEDEDPEAKEERKRQLMAEYDIDPPEEASRKSKDLDIARTNDDTFTMDMMLRSMNIDLDLIGFDPERQCWKE